jgi:hypothetical protein
MYGGNIPPIKIAGQRKAFREIIEAISPRENKGACGCEVSRQIRAGHHCLPLSLLISLAGQDPKETAPRRALLFNADYNLVAIATHDPEEGQEVGEDVVHV